ncbi:MAG: tetratricopeptide repeat protein, partial [Desulfamplus sp.]|nr:tetratricopeptide repeat protein [Desulfamplus sp.]
KIYSMANALLLSGVHHYIGTFWEIQDDYSREFAMTCYKEILAGSTIGDAIKKARKSFVDAHGEDAIIWASYLLYGDPRICYTKNSTTLNNSTEIEQDDISKSQKRDRDGKKLKRLLLMVGIALLIIFGVLGYNISYKWHLERKADKLKAEVSGYINQAQIEFQKGELDKAKQSFEKVVNMADSSYEHKAEAFMGLGRVASSKGSSDEALSFYEQASQYAVKSEDSFQGVNKSQNKNSDTISIEEANIAQQAQIAKALVLSDKGDYEAALLLLNQAKLTAKADIIPQPLIQEVEQRVSISKNREKQQQIKELITSLLAQKDNLENSLSDKDKNSLYTTSQKQSVDNLVNQPLTMWIMDFNTTGYTLQEGHSQILASALAGVLLDKSSVRLVERAMLDKVLEELNLGTTELMSKETALSIGKLMSAKTMLSGQMIFTNSEIQVSLRLIETETGQIVLSVNRVFGSLVPVSLMADELGSEVSQKIKTIYNQN